MQVLEEMTETGKSLNRNIRLSMHIHLDEFNTWEKIVISLEKC